MRLTRASTAWIRALASAAQDGDTTPSVCRVALAVHEGGPDGLTSRELEEYLETDGGALRNTLGEMYDSGLAHGKGVDGGRRRRGVVTRVTLTPSGRHLAEQVVAQQRARANPGGGATQDATPMREAYKATEPVRRLDDTGFSAGTV